MLNRLRNQEKQVLKDIERNAVRLAGGSVRGVASGSAISVISSVSDTPLEEVSEDGYSVSQQMMWDIDFWDRARWN